jgi:iron complex outermembrane receptor protein
VNTIFLLPFICKQGLSANFCPKGIMMKKTIWIIVSMIATIHAKAQTTTDSNRIIELPASKVKAVGNKLNLNNKDVLLVKKGSNTERISQTQDIPFLLQEISSIVASSDAGTGTGYTGIRIRGTDLTRINVSMNGIPVNDPESQATYFVNTPDLISSTQQIEITKGIGASKNGNGSFGGAIAINTLDIHDEKANGGIQLDYGSFKTLRTTARVTTGLINDKFVATFRASQLSSDGYVDRSFAKLKSMQFTAKYIIDSSSSFIFNYLKGAESTGLAWNGLRQDSLKTNRRFNSLGLMPNGEYYQNQSDNYGQDYYQLFYDKKLNNHWTIGSTLFLTKGKGYYEEYQMNQALSDYYLPNIIRGNDTIASAHFIRQLWLDNNYYGARLYANYVTKKLEAGIYFNYSQYDGKHFGEIIWNDVGIESDKRWYDLNAQKNELNTYAMANYKLSKDFSLFGDLQLRQVNYEINGFRKNPGIQHNLNFHFVNPKVKLTYQKKNRATYLFIGRVSKEPNRDDIEANTIDLPKPEILTHAEMNHAHFITKKVIIRATAYWMYYTNQLIQTGKINDVGAYARINVPSSYRTGIELENEWRFNLFQIALNATFSQNKIKSFTEYQDDYDAGEQISVNHRNTDIAFSPNVILGGRLSFFPFKNDVLAWYQNASLDVLPKYVSKQYLDNTQNENRKLDAYSNLDLVMNLPLQLNKYAKFNVRFATHNVFNTMYENNGYTFSYISNNLMTTENYVFPQAGRRFTIGIGWQF